MTAVSGHCISEKEACWKEMLEKGVIHGRFQVLHNDHLRYLLTGKARCNHLVVGITNPDPTLTRDDKAAPARSSPAANPLTYYERYCIIRTTLFEQGLDIRRFSVVPFPINVPDLYRHYVPLDATFFLTIYDQWGEKKFRLFQSLGLKIEVLWRKPLEEKGLSATEIRRYIATNQPWEHLVPATVARMLKELQLVERIRNAYTDTSREGRDIYDAGGLI